jgi:hypothetical protein
MRDVPIRQVAIDAGRLLVVPDADEGDSTLFTVQA